MSLAVGRNVGPYRILARTRLGENGTLYKAVHIEQRKTFALKELVSALEASNDAHRLFLEKLKIAARLDHPQIGRTFLPESYGEYHAALTSQENVTGNPVRFQLYVVEVD